MVTPSEDNILLNDYISIARHMTSPYFFSTLFPEVPVALCSPLDPPFDHFAVTAHGTVFLYRPLKTVHFSFDLLESTMETYIDPVSCCVPKPDHEGRLYIVLITYYGIHHTFYIDELICRKFFNIPSNQPIQVEYHDRDFSNIVFNNLEAFYV